jgi:hypothetical protein
MSDTADLNRWGRRPYDERVTYGLRSPWSIVLVVLGFIVWWPIGLALLFFKLGSRNMGCWDRQGRFEHKMQRMQDKMERMRGRMESRGFGGFGFGEPTSKRSSMSSRASSSACVTPRTRKSSTSSWPSTASVRPRRRRTTTSRRADVSRINIPERGSSLPRSPGAARLSPTGGRFRLKVPRVEMARHCPELSLMVRRRAATSRTMRWPGSEFAAMVRDARQRARSSPGGRGSIKKAPDVTWRSRTSERSFISLRNSPW